MFCKSSQAIANWAVQENRWFTGISGAAELNRTTDPVLTKDVLYH